MRLRCLMRGLAMSWILLLLLLPLLLVPVPVPVLLGCVHPFVAVEDGDGGV